MSKLNKVEELKTKRFVVRKSLIGKNVVFSFTNKKGDTNNIPTICRNVEIL